MKHIQVSRSIRNILSNDKNEKDHATLSQTKFNVLDELMHEVNKIIGVHCKETADMTSKIWNAQSKIFRSSGSELQHLYLTNRRLLKTSSRLEHELSVMKTHTTGTISSLEDRVKLLESSLHEFKIKNEVLRRKLECSEEERKELHKTIADKCKGSDIEVMTNKLESMLDKMEVESRKQTEYMLEIEDEFGLHRDLDKK